MTLKDAMLSVGYAESTATKGQTRVLGYVRNNEKFCTSFEKKGITTDSVAEKYAQGLDAVTPSGKTDYNARYKYVAAVTEIMSGYPSKRVEMSGDPDRPLFRDLPDAVKKMCSEITANVAKHDS